MCEGKEMVDYCQSILGPVKYFSRLLVKYPYKACCVKHAFRGFEGRNMDIVRFLP